MNHYFNTTGEAPQLELQFERKATKQEALILNVMRLYRKDFTAFELLAHFPANTPVTSVRRALTLLHQAGQIRRVGKRLEPFGRNNYTYAL